MSQGQQETVRVTIFGEDYTIRSPMGPDYTKKCADFVDQAINEAHVRGHISEAHKAAILAAMQITDQLFRAQAELASLESMTEERLSALQEKVEVALDR
jgi:cell division protein ZapA